MGLQAWPCCHSDNAALELQHPPLPGEVVIWGPTRAITLSLEDTGESKGRVGMELAVGRMVWLLRVMYLETKLGIREPFPVSFNIENNIL